MRAANLAVKFLLELAAFASLAVWGWHAGIDLVGNALAAVVLAVLVPAAAIAVWGLWCAPRAARRLPATWRVPLELGILLLSAAALGAAGHPTAAVVFAVVVVVNAVGLTVFGQWDH